MTTNQIQPMKSSRSKSKFTVWIHGSIMGQNCWQPGKILAVQEGFSSKRDAKAWAIRAMKTHDTPGKSYSQKYTIGPAY